jgi:hypothetical protein
VFQITFNGTQVTETVLYNFCSQGGSACTDGSQPVAGLVLDQSGNLYGTTDRGGGNDLDHNSGGAGVVYQLTPGNTWSETVLHRFCSASRCKDGAYPRAALTLDAAGNLFGTTSVGGGNCSLNGTVGCGVVFKLVPNGELSQETVLYAFCSRSNCADGDQPYAQPIVDANGNLFGTTEFGGGNNIDAEGFGGGVVYELAGSTYKVLHRFCTLANCADGEYPQSPLVMQPSGDVLGITYRGGATDDGAVFRARP